MAQAQFTVLKEVSPQRGQEVRVEEEEQIEASLADIKQRNTQEEVVAADEAQKGKVFGQRLGVKEKGYRRRMST